jgi:hypothetical protein
LELVFDLGIFILLEKEMKASSEYWQVRFVKLADSEGGTFIKESIHKVS